MSGYAWTATRICATCCRSFTAHIAIAATAGVVWWRCEPTHCPDCLKGDAS